MTRNNGNLWFSRESPSNDWPIEKVALVSTQTSDTRRPDPAGFPKHPNKSMFPPNRRRCYEYKSQFFYKNIWRKSYNQHITAATATKRRVNTFRHSNQSIFWFEFWSLTHIKLRWKNSNSTKPGRKRCSIKFGLCSNFSKTPQKSSKIITTKMFTPYFSKRVYN